MRFLLSVFTFLLVAFTFVSCSFNANLQGKGEAYLQGEWRQDSVPMQQKLTEYSLYNVSFSCDSFFMRISSFSKVNNGAGTCTASGHWTEYVKGGYQQHDDTLHVRGQFCNANFSLKQDGDCPRSGIYEETLIVKKLKDSLLRFSPESSVIPIDLHLIKHTICTQKPL
jgi:hypothetical protein